MVPEARVGGKGAIPEDRLGGKGLALTAYVGKKGAILEDRHGGKVLVLTAKLGGFNEKTSAFMGARVPREYIDKGIRPVPVRN